jgi:folate-binding protein YgfZ
MMTQIKTFLIKQGALFVGEDLVGFNNELQSTDSQSIDSICPLLNLGLLEVEGDDAVNFLQGQLTNDIKLLNGNNSHYTGYCSPKGRLINLFLAFSHRDHIHLQLPRSQVEFILKRLRMFVLRSKVTINDQSDNIIGIGIAGPNATEKLKAIFKQVPKNPHEIITFEDETVVKLPGNVDRYQVLTSSKTFERVWDALSNNSEKVGTEVWDYLEILSGIPEIVENTRDSFVPQMVNLDVINGINFKKGCYTGQEIVARTHYLGTVKRRTYIAHINSKNRPNAGDKVYLNSNENEIGEIVRSAKAPDGGYQVLAEIRVENFIENKNDIVWNESPLIFKNLPYPL